MEPIRILYVNGGPLNRGGIESYMMNYYREFNKEKIQIDFVSIGLQRAAYDEEIESLGGKIYYIPKKSKNYLEYKKALKDIFLTEKYKIVHTHMDAMGITVLKEAKKCNIPVRIAHSHNTKHLTSNFIKLIINEYARKNINKYATHMFACSEVAGRWLFGDKEYEKENVKIIKNAISIDKFNFNLKKRNKLRNSLNILNDELVVGHIGRFDYQKNHKFLLEVFKKASDRKCKLKLILIGDGHLRDEIEAQIKELNIEEKVIMLGMVNNVHEYYNVFDMFILPSLFEGLPVVGIEAQANGLTCIFSDVITTELAINKNVEFISLKDIDKWSEKICSIPYNTRINGLSSIRKKGYDIINESRKLEEKYISLCKENL